jgi:hypothetical protein
LNNYSFQWLEEKAGTIATLENACSVAQFRIAVCQARSEACCGRKFGRDIIRLKDGVRNQLLTVPWRLINMNAVFRNLPYGNVFQLIKRDIKTLYV